MSDDPRSVAFDPNAPQDERTDALGQLQKAHMPTTSALIPPDNIQRIINVINDGLDEGAMLKARNIQVYQDERGGWGPAGNKVEPRRNKHGMQSLYVDELQVSAAGDYFEKPSPLNFDALRVMCEQTPILAAIIQTRIRQVNRFCNPSEDGGPGFEIRHIDRKHILTPEEETVTGLLSQFVQHCGWEFNSRKRKALRRETFAGFMSKSIRDSMSMDSCPIETEWKRDRSLGLDGFYAVDGATIRLCQEEGYEGDDSIYALQVVQGRIVTGYTYDQLIYEVRNPRTDVRLAGYGLGEPELLVRVVTGFLNAMTYNSKGFDENSIPKGLLHMSGDYGQEDLIAFRRYWNSMVKGINNSWALPVMISKDQESKATFEKFGVEFDEMHFSKWMTFLTSMVCSIYGMDPAEINFESFSADKSSLSGSDTREKLGAAKDKGLHPFLSFYENLMSDFVLSEWEKYCFRWVGLDDEDPAQAWEADQKILTVNELRARRGEQPYPTDGEGPDIGAAPLNPDLIAVWSQVVMPQPTAPGQEFGGQAGEEDFGTVPGESGGKPAPGMPADKAPDKAASGGGDFAAKKDPNADLAKAIIWRL